MFQFLTPGFFDALVWLTLIVGVGVAIVRIYQDFKCGPRSFAPRESEPSNVAADKPTKTTGANNNDRH